MSIQEQIARERFHPIAPETERFLVGSDFFSAEDMTIPGVVEGSDASSKIVKLIIPAGSIPPFHELTPNKARFVHATMQSRKAQSGLEPDDAIFTHIYLDALKHGSLDRFGRLREPFETEGIFHNRSKRGIYIPKESRMGRFYDRLANPVAQGRVLHNLIHEQKEIKIGGIFGKDWTYVHGQGEKTIDNIIGITMKLNSDYQKHIPYNSEPLYIADDTANYREILDRDIFQDAPETDEDLHIVSETQYELLLGDHVDAEIDQAAPVDIHSVDDVDTWTVHVNSRWLDRKKTKWNIRTETVSKGIKNQRAGAIILYFHVDPKLLVAAK